MVLACFDRWKLLPAVHVIMSCCTSSLDYTHVTLICESCVESWNRAQRLQYIIHFYFKHSVGVYLVDLNIGLMVSQDQLAIRYPYSQPHECQTFRLRTKLNHTQIRPICPTFLIPQIWYFMLIARTDLKISQFFLELYSVSDSQNLSSNGYIVMKQ